MRLAVWSGPRNLSTALMYSFSQRPDCTVIDEPYYAAYLAATGLKHPMLSDILGSQPNNPNVVSNALANPPSRPIRYEKHMCHHMLPDWDLDWIASVQNVFLIRHPARVIASYDAKRERPTLDDIGVKQQLELFERTNQGLIEPVVVDSADIRAEPKQTLTKLCDRLEVPFFDEMLTWPEGGNAADGVWASHWYGAVHGSTTFAGKEDALPDLRPELSELANRALTYYEQLSAYRI